MKQLAVIFLMLLGCSSFSQIEPSKQRHNFGDLYKGSTTYTDITFKNTSEKPQYLLTIDKPKDVYYIYSAKKLLPDSSITIRFKINENIKGRFTYNINVYFSNPRSAIQIQLNGNVKQAEGSTSMTDCPDFNNQPPSNQSTAFNVTIRVIDSLTREPIKNAKVYLVQNGQLLGEYMTNNKGVVVKKIPLGYYYITAKRTPYMSNYHEGYLNWKRNYVEIELQQKKMEEEIIIPPPEDVIVIEEKPDTVIEEVIVVQEIKPEVVEVEKDTVVLVPEVDPIEFTEVPDSVFTDSYFKYNNITFILDVSTSMNGMGKMKLLKLAIVELVEILRPEDMVSILKYSSETEVILKNTMGDQKEAIINSIKDLIGTGYTAGGNAIKAAYKLNRRQHIQDGNNMVIMITDGVFNRGDKDYLKTIQSAYNSRGTTFSVVGIKTSDFITKHMKDIVEEGGGDFIRILTEQDAKTKLIGAIKRSSYKFDIAKE